MRKPAVIGIMEQRLTGTAAEKWAIVKDLINEHGQKVRNLAQTYCLNEPRLPLLFACNTTIGEIILSIHLNGEYNYMVCANNKLHEYRLNLAHVVDELDMPLKHAETLAFILKTINRASFDAIKKSSTL